jgi:hypothetical protein
MKRPPIDRSLVQVEAEVERHRVAHILAKTWWKNRHRGRVKAAERAHVTFEDVVQIGLCALELAAKRSAPATHGQAPADAFQITEVMRATLERAYPDHLFTTLSAQLHTEDAAGIVRGGRYLQSVMGKLGQWLIITAQFTVNRRSPTRGPSPAKRSNSRRS